MFKKKYGHAIFIENQEACGFRTTGDRNQVYKLESNRHDNPLCLAGTAEISLAGMNSNFQPTVNILHYKCNAYIHVLE